MVFYSYPPLPRMLNWNQSRLSCFTTFDLFSSSQAHVKKRTTNPSSLPSPQSNKTLVFSPLPIRAHDLVIISSLNQRHKDEKDFMNKIPFRKIGIERLAKYLRCCPWTPLIECHLWKPRPADWQCWMVASGSYLRRGLRVAVYTETASGHKVLTLARQEEMLLAYIIASS